MVRESTAAEEAKPNETPEWGEKLRILVALQWTLETRRK